MPVTQLVPAVQFERRKPLDGLRGVLSMIVVLFHLKIPFFSQGYIGVDSFFVLSGFVITSITLVEIRNSNTLNFSHFYARRIKRLLPASLFVIICSASAYKYLFSSFHVERNRMSFIAATSFWENIYLIVNSKNYFGANIDESPLMHYWSLSIEEQFYLVYPTIFFLFTKYDRKSLLFTKSIFFISIVGLLLYQVYALYFGYGYSFTYFATRFRIYQLLSGCLTSLFLFNETSNSTFRKNKFFGNLMSIGGLFLLLILSTNVIKTNSANAGFYSTICTLCIIIGFELEPKSILASVLSTDVLQFFGKHSYSIYLWHYPIILIFGSYLHKSIFSYFNFVLVIICLSYITLILIESPCKKTKVSDKFIVIIGVAGIVLTLLVIVLIMFPIQLYSLSNVDSKLILENNLIEKEIYTQEYNVDIHSEDCEHPNNDVYLIGDSFAAEWIDAITKLSKDYNRGSNIHINYQYGTVPFLNTIQYDKNYRSMEETVNSFGEYWMEMKNNSNDKVIFLFSYSVTEVIFENEGEYIHPGTDEWKYYINRKLIEQYTTIPSTKTVAVIPHYPEPPNLFICKLSNDVHECKDSYRAHNGTFVEEYIEILQDIHKEFGETFQVINFNDIICPGGKCKAIVDGEIVFRDTLHISESFALSKIQELDDKLRPFYEGVSLNNICTFK